MSHEKGKSYVVEGLEGGVYKKSDVALKVVNSPKLRNPEYVDRLKSTINNLVSGGVHIPDLYGVKNVSTNDGIKSVLSMSFIDNAINLATVPVRSTFEQKQKVFNQIVNLPDSVWSTWVNDVAKCMFAGIQVDANPDTLNFLLSTQNEQQVIYTVDIFHFLKDINHAQSFAVNSIDDVVPKLTNYLFENVKFLCIEKPFDENARISPELIFDFNKFSEKVTHIMNLEIDNIKESKMVKSL